MTTLEIAARGKPISAGPYAHPIGMLPRCSRCTHPTLSRAGSIPARYLLWKSDGRFQPVCASHYDTLADGFGDGYAIYLLLPDETFESVLDATGSARPDGARPQLTVIDGGRS